MIQAIKENKKSIIISLIVGILIFYSQPLLTFVGTQIVNLFVAVSTKFSNYFYQLVAQNDPNLISDYVASIVVLLFWFLAVDLFVEPLVAIKTFESELKVFERKIKGGEGDLTREEVNIESEIANLKKTIKKKKVLTKLVITISFLMFLYFSFKQGIYSEVNLNNVSFQNNLTVLSVHLSDNEIKQLRANWVQMKSADDYKQIKTTIADYYKKYNLK